MDEQEIKLCKECEICELETSQEKHLGICEMCQNEIRLCEQSANQNRGICVVKKYKPVKDRSEHEKNQFRNRYLNKKNRKLSQVKTQLDPEKSKYKDVIIFLQTNENIKNMRYNEISELIYNKFSNMNLTNMQLSKLLNTYKIEYVKCAPGTNHESKYTKYVDDLIILCKTRTLTEVFEYLNQINNNPFENMQKLRSYIYNNKIPYIKCNKQGLPIVSEQDKINIMKRDELDKELVYLKPQNTIHHIIGCADDMKCEVIDNETHESYNLPDVLDNNNKDIISNEDIELDDIDPSIKTYILGTLNRKFELLRCKDKLEYNIDEIIKAVQIIKDFKTRYPLYLSNGVKQHEVMNDFQSDLIHIFENTRQNTTELSDKLTYLRVVRRDLQFGKTYINAIKPLIDSIPLNGEQLSQVEENLIAAKYDREHPTYIPLVDMDMIERYEWAAQPSKLQNKYERNNLSLKVEVSDKETVYECTCFISGGGYGTFRPYNRTYTASSEQMAQNMFNKDLDNIKRNTKGILITDIKIKQKRI